MFTSGALSLGCLFFSNGPLQSLVAWPYTPGNWASYLGVLLGWRTFHFSCHPVRMAGDGDAMHGRCGSLNLHFALKLKVCREDNFCEFYEGELVNTQELLLKLNIIIELSVLGPVFMLLFHENGLYLMYKLEWRALYFFIFASVL